LIKITHKEVAVLIGKSEGYTRQLLKRRGIALKPENTGPLVDLIAEYRKKHG
jgi:hypothetical protein